MREISFETVKELWKECRTPTMLYIHSPFCEQQCSYCVYRGRRPEGEEVVRQYYYDYLPRQIERNLPILESLPSVPEVYFGGGTANFRGQLFHLEPAIDLIKPFMKRAEEVTIELHMGYPVTRDQISWLKRQGFTTVILCVQSLDVDFIRSKNRLCRLSQKEYIEQLSNVLEWVHEEEMKSAIDLMFFPLDEDNDQSLMKTFDLLSEMPYTPDEISVATEYQNKFKETTDLDLVHVFDRFSSHSLFDEYSILGSLTNAISCRVFRWFRKNLLEEREQGESSFFNFMKYLDDQEQFFCSSTLGIGSFRNLDKNTFSVVNGKYCYSEVCSDLSQEPSYHLLREVSFWDKCHNMLDWLEYSFEGINLPREVCLLFNNNPDSDNYSRDCQDNTVYFEISSSGKEEIPPLIRQRLNQGIQDFRDNPELLRGIQCRSRRKI